MLSKKGYIFEDSFILIPEHTQLAIAPNDEDTNKADVEPDSNDEENNQPHVDPVQPSPSNSLELQSE